MIIKSIFILLLSFHNLFAADLPALKKLFQENCQHFYLPRYCGRNIAKLIDEANKKNINLDNTYVLKIEGGGFLETSGFYTRTMINERSMLGYFHMVLVSDGYVFDFDLAEPLVLKIEDYIRLQFTPPYEPYTIFGMEWISHLELPRWSVTRFEWRDYIKNNENPTWKKRMSEFVEIENILKKKRIR